MMTPALNRFNTPLRALFWLSLLGILAGSIAGVLIERDIRGDFGNFYVLDKRRSLARPRSFTIISHLFKVRNRSAIWRF